VDDSPVAAEDVVAELARAPRLAGATIKTLLNRLLKKGAIRAAKDGRRYLYSPVLKREDWVHGQSRSLPIACSVGASRRWWRISARRASSARKDIAELKRLIGRSKMASEVLPELLQAALAASAAIVLMQAVRKPLRARFGARIAYRAWLLVPVAMLAVLAAGASAPIVAGVGVEFLPPGAGAWTHRVAAAAPLAWNSLLLLTWGWAASLQWRASRHASAASAASSSAAPAAASTSSSGHGPAVIGWWRSRIVLPVDFRERYTPGERRLVLAHEIAHLRAGDIHAQALATALRCLFWFNPLVHLAAAQFRFDQELAWRCRRARAIPARSRPLRQRDAQDPAGRLRIAGRLPLAIQPSTQGANRNAEATPAAANAQAGWFRAGRDARRLRHAGGLGCAAGHGYDEGRVAEARRSRPACLPAACR
jgi:predicted transcriptional regulator